MSVHDLYRHPSRREEKLVAQYDALCKQLEEEMKRGGEITPAPAHVELNPPSRLGWIVDGVAPIGSDDS